MASANYTQLIAKSIKHNCKIDVGNAYDVSDDDDVTKSDQRSDLTPVVELRKPLPTCFRRRQPGRYSSSLKIQFPDPPRPCQQSSPPQNAKIQWILDVGLIYMGHPKLCKPVPTI